MVTNVKVYRKNGDTMVPTSWLFVPRLTDTLKRYIFLVRQKCLLDK